MLYRKDTIRYHHPISILFDGASPEDNHVLANIADEMMFFSSLVVASEVLRQFANRYSAAGSRIPLIFWISTLVCSWYAVSITLLLFNKFLITQWSGTGITFPIFYTDMHMVLKGIFASAYFFLVRMEGLPRVDRKTCLGLALAGSMASLDIAASNLSLTLISVSFYTFLKSASIVFVLVLAVTARVETCTFSLSATVATICFGMFLTTWGEVDINWNGFCLVMSSEIFCAFRWIITQLMVQASGIDAITAVLYMAPASSLTLAPFAAVLERHELESAYSLMMTKGAFLVLFVLPGFLAFLLLLIECQLVKETSGLTLTLFGNLKSVSTIIFATVVFHEKTTPIQWCGLMVVLMGMMAYSYAKGEWLWSKDSSKPSPSEGSSLLDHAKPMAVSKAVSSSVEAKLR